MSETVGRTYQRVRPRGGSVYAGTITTQLTILASDQARKLLTWRDVDGNVENVTESMVRDSHNFTPAALYRDGYNETAY